MKIIFIILATFSCLHAEVETVKKHENFKCFISQNDRKSMNEKIAENIEKGTSELAVKLLSSIIHKDEDAFVGCFMTKEDIIKLSKKLNFEEEYLNKFLEHQRELKESLGPFYKRTLELSKEYNLSKEVQIKSIEVNVSASPETEYGVTWMLIEFTCNQKSYFHRCPVVTTTDSAG